MIALQVTLTLVASILLHLLIVSSDGGWAIAYAASLIAYGCMYFAFEFATQSRFVRLQAKIANCSGEAGITSGGWRVSSIFLMTSAGIAALYYLATPPCWFEIKFTALCFITPSSSGAILGLTRALYPAAISTVSAFYLGLTLLLVVAIIRKKPFA